MAEEVGVERVKFYGPKDLGSALTAESAVALMQAYMRGRSIVDINDALELFNALEYERHSILPVALNADDRAGLKAAAKPLRDQVSLFFRGIDQSSFTTHLHSTENEFKDDLLTLILRFKVDRLLEKEELVDLLLSAGMPLWMLLSSGEFVRSYDQIIRKHLLTDPKNAEFLINMHLVKDGGSHYTLPPSFTGEDVNQLVTAYLDSESPHLNYVQVVAEASNDSKTGITDKLRLKARRRLTELSKALFESGTGVTRRNGYGVRIDPDQDVPVRESVDSSTEGIESIRILGGKHLLANLDQLSILNNFAQIIDYMDGYGLKMPSFKADLGVLRQLFITGNKAYPRGGAYEVKDALTGLGTDAYHSLLEGAGIDVEEVIAWFFREHLRARFQAFNFRYTASTPGSSWVERARHVASEMEGAAKQFSLYCEEGEIDRGLFEMSSGSVSWKALPSLNKRKYALPAENGTCEELMALLFSDQAGVTYISEELKADNFVNLVRKHDIRYSALNAVQKHKVGVLLGQELLVVEDDQLRFPNLEQIGVLSHIYYREAAPFHRYSAELSEAAIALEMKGIVSFSSTLLTPAEASYFNFWLNKSEFSDGPDLRNTYAHGTNPDPEQVDRHRFAYMSLLRLTISLVLKIWDDFERAAATAATISTGDGG